MSKQDSIDKGRNIDWGHTSDDYASYRPGPPDSFYEKLLTLGVGIKNQKILDLGTGTGVLARKFSKQNAIVSGIDISEEQIAQAKKLALQDNLKIDFRVSAAETTPFKDHSFDVITANQCWLYFDKEKAIAETKRLLVKNGLLMISHFVWLPRQDKIAHESEKLILKYNPQWTGNDYDENIPEIPDWAKDDFNMKFKFCYNEHISFTRASWRGRIRASRGIAATLTNNEVEAFDKEHAKLLEKIAPEKFTVLHQVVAYIMQFK